MSNQSIKSSCLAFAALLTVAALPVLGTDLMPQNSIDRMGGQRYWEASLPLAGGETVQRTALLDDNLYVMTDANRVYAIHALTGVMRWSRIIAEPGQTVRGPAHNDQYVFFTTGGSVTLLNRRSGDAAVEPRSIEGVIIEVRHDTATISKGSDHGVRPKDVLQIYRVGDSGEVSGDAIAQLRIETTSGRTSRGRLFRLNSGLKAEAGDHALADIELPLKQVKLPFAASCAAVADEHRIYVGAANQRFYSLDIIGGFQHWQLMTPKTVSATPVLRGPNLYFAGQDGDVVSCTSADRVKNWVFETEAPIFADLVVTVDSVMAASSDRSLYCLDRVTGKRRWRVRFDRPLNQPPVLSGGRVFQQVPELGLVVLDLATGEELWKREAGGQFLCQFEDDVLLLVGDSLRHIVRMDAKSGQVRELADVADVRFAEADRESQAIILANACGELLCLRSKKAPYLKPAQLAEVLRSDAKMKIAERMDAERKAKADAAAVAPAEEKPRLPEWLLEDDFLSSRNTAKPVGGRGLVDAGEDAPKKAESAAKDEADEESAEDESAEDSDDEAASDESEDEDSADEDSGDDEEADSSDSEDEDSGDEDADSDDEDSEDEDSEDEDSEDE